MEERLAALENEIQELGTGVGASNIEVLGLVIAALGFFVIVLQLWIGLRLLKGNMVARLYGELHEIHRVFVEYPEIRPYFYHKRPLALSASEENSETYYRARAVAEMFFDVFEHIYVLRGEMTSEVLRPVPFSGGNVAENWDNYIHHMIMSSHFLSSYLIETRDYLHPIELRKFVDEHVRSHWPEIGSGQNQDKA